MRGGYRWGRRALLAAGILPLWLGGCQVPEPRVPVVGVKNAGVGAAAGRAGWRRVLLWGRAERQQYAAENGGSCRAGCGEQRGGSAGGFPSGEHPGADQAPEVYEVQLKTDAIQLQGEAAVWVPEGEDLRCTGL